MRSKTRWLSTDVLTSCWQKAVSIGSLGEGWELSDQFTFFCLDIPASYWVISLFSTGFHKTSQGKWRGVLIVYANRWGRLLTRQWVTSLSFLATPLSCRVIFFSQDFTKHCNVNQREISPFWRASFCSTMKINENNFMIRLIFSNPFFRTWHIFRVLSIPKRVLIRNWK